jgi:hypothetical protein
MDSSSKRSRQAPRGAKVRCSCGKKLRVPLDTERKWLRCPFCELPVQIPAPQSVPSAAEAESALAPAVGAETAAVAGSVADSQPPAATSPATAFPADDVADGPIDRVNGITSRRLGRRAGVIASLFAIAVVIVLVGFKVAGSRAGAEADGRITTGLTFRQDRAGATPDMETALGALMDLDKPIAAVPLGDLFQYLANKFGLTITIDEMAFFQMYGATNLPDVPINLPAVPGESVEQFVRRVCRQARGHMQIDDGRIYLTTLPRVRVSAAPTGDSVRVRGALNRIERLLDIRIDTSGARASETREVPVPGPEAMPLGQFLERLLRPAGCECSFAGTECDVVVRQGSPDAGKP